MIKVSRLAGSWGAVCVLLLVGWFQAGCKTGGSDSKYAETPEPGSALLASTGPVTNTNGPVGPATGNDSLDALHVGDTLTVEFSDMPLSITPREERIREDGTITLLEQKSFVAAGKTRGQLEKEIHDWYVPRFYLKMTVSIRQLKDTQFYYVRGEVRIPGRQVYISRITVLKAIGSAGDFTDFARKSEVQLTRADGRKITINAKKALKNPSLDLEIFPGDTVFVPRRTIFY
jgi:protein involved in polysaccharide export with SLBB domain